MLSYKAQPSWAPKSCSVSIYLPLSSPCSPRAVVGWSSQAGLQCPACAGAVGTPHVSQRHFSPLLYRTRTLSAVFLGTVTISWLSFHSMFVSAAAQIKKDRATFPDWLNSGWKMVVDYFPQGNLGEKRGQERKADSLIFTPAFSWGAAQWHDVQDMLWIAPCGQGVLTPRASCSKGELPPPLLRDQNAVQSPLRSFEWSASNLSEVPGSFSWKGWYKLKVSYLWHLESQPPTLRIFIF